MVAVNQDSSDDPDYWEVCLQIYLVLTYLTDNCPWFVLQDK
jgi:hypothetical protein